MWLERPEKLFRGAVLSLLMGALSGCISPARTEFPVDPAGQETAADGVTITRLTPDNIAQFAPKEPAGGGGGLPSATRGWEYRVGVGDVLGVTVWDHPELTLPAGQARSAQESGSRVDADGTIFYPYVGRMQVAGQPISHIQTRLTEALAEFIPDPQVEVKVLGFNAQKVSVTGMVAHAGPQKITNIPLTLVEAINAVGGLTPQADSRNVKIRRGGKVYSINLHAFLVEGRRSGNPVLRGGDIVTVPRLDHNVAYVLGQVQNPGPVDLGLEGMTLTGALATQGGLQKDLADARGIFVFRAGKAGFEVFQLDASTPLAFVLATKFALAPQDVVYVTTDPAARWNAVIANILPSLGVVRGVQAIGGGG